MSRLNIQLTTKQYNINSTDHYSVTANLERNIKLLSMKLFPHLLLFTAQLIGLALFCPLSVSGDVTAPASEPTALLTAQLDAFVSRTFPADLPGAAIGVSHQGKILLRKGYGMANLELGIPMNPEHVFRLGSITKQFTAVAILQLVEAGKIKLDDDITTYLPEVPTGGRKVTIAHLLTHTSGLPDMRFDQRQEITLTDIVASMKDKPANFAPGTDYAYSNNGFRLLGGVIEKASGQSYADYIDDHIFKPAGMTHSSYDRPERVFPQRIPGYTTGADGTTANAASASPTLATSAGALLSTVDDLGKWEQALAAGKLVSPALLAQARTSVHLPDGRATGYGFGWAVGSLAGHSTVEHSGGIPGFSTYELRVADADLYIVVLCNSDTPKADPSWVGRQLASRVLGKSASIATVKVRSELLRHYAAVYRLNPSSKIAFAVENDQLLLQRPDGSSIPLQAISTNEFLAPESDARYQFVLSSAGGPARLLFSPAVGVETFADRVDEPLDEPEKTAVVVPAETLEKYVGEYEVAPGFVFLIKHVGAGLTSQPTGQGPVDLVAESAVRFFIKPAPNVHAEFKCDANGQVTSLVVLQDGAEIPAKKIK